MGEAAISSTQVGLPAGAVVAGKYRIERKLGEGGMGAVYLAVNTVLDQRVVLKLLLVPRGKHGGEATKRFLREARVAAKLQHENVIRVLDFGSLPDGAPFLVLEYLDGYDLEHRLVDHGPLSVEEVATRVYDALRGLAVIHEAGIVHRDIKPANLFVAQRQGGGDVVKVLDFGLAKSEDDDHALTATSDVMGSPIYMSPEQLRSSKHVEARTDIWSMGVVMYELLTGDPPFMGSGLGEIIPAIMNKAPRSICERRAGVPPALEAVVLRCLEKDAADRFASARELAEALAPFAPGVAPLSQPNLRAAGVSAVGTGSAVGPGATAKIPSSEPALRAAAAVSIPLSALEEQPTEPFGVPLRKRSTQRRHVLLALTFALVGGSLIAIVLVFAARPPPAPEPLVFSSTPPPTAPPAPLETVTPLAPSPPEASSLASSPSVPSAQPSSARMASRPPVARPSAVVSAVAPAPAPPPKPKDFEGQK